MKNCRCGAALAEDGPGLCLPCYEATHGRSLTECQQEERQRKVREILRLKGLSYQQKDIALMVGVTEQYVSQVVWNYRKLRQEQRG